MPAIETKNLSYTYGEKTVFRKTAVDNISISIEKGEFAGVIGHTGSGKSTLMQLLNGLIKPSSGSVLLNGEDIWRNPKKIRDVRFKVGLCFQYPEHQLFEQTVYADIAFGPKNMGLDGDEIKKRVESAAEFVSVSRSYFEKSPFELSGGEKRRVAIAGVLAMDPEVLIMDEPTAGLDPKGRDGILSAIRDYKNTKNSTIIFVSHSMEDVARLCSTVIVMNQGRCEMHGTASEIYSQPDALSAIGLNVPQITRIFLALKARGFDVRTDVLTARQGRDETLRLLGKEAGM